MTFAEYQAIDAINATAIKAGRTSMRHMRHVMTGGAKEQTAAMRWGSIVHAAILEPDRFFAEASVFGGAVRRGKEWDAFKAEHNEDLIITRDEHAELFALSASVHADKDAHRMIDGARHEVTLQWDRAAGWKCKARLDGWSTEYGVIEVKTTSKIAPDLFARQFVGMGYDLQCGWYATGAGVEFGGTPDVHIIAIEAESPYCVAVYRVPRMTVEIGARRAIAIADRYHACVKDGVFGGPVDGITELVMPPWYATEAEQAECFAEESAAGLGL